MKKTNKRSKTSKRRGRTQKLWKMRGCAPHSCVCTKCHHKCNAKGICPVCHHTCGHKHKRGSAKVMRLKKSLRNRHGKYIRGRSGGTAGKYMRGRSGGSPDAPLAYSGNGINVPTMPNPHYAYTGQAGGYVPSAVPPLIGSPWGGEVDQWPGVAGPHDGNYFKPNSYNVQPEMQPIDERTTSNILGGGGRRRRRRTRKMRGGLNFGMFSQVGSDLNNVYRGLNGSPALPSPLPYKDQIFYGNNAQDNLNYLKVG